MGQHRWTIPNQRRRRSESALQLPTVSFLIDLQTSPPYILLSHRSGVLEILNIPDSPSPATRPAVARAILEWEGTALEEACAQRGLCVFKMRTRVEWEATAQGQALIGAPVLQVRPLENRNAGKGLRVGKGQLSKRPLQDVKVLDLSRVLAGPVCGRALAGTFIIFDRFT